MALYRTVASLLSTSRKEKLKHVLAIATKKGWKQVSTKGIGIA